MIYDSVVAAMHAGEPLRSESRQLYGLFLELDGGPPDLRRAVVLEWASNLDLLARLCPGGKLDMDAWRKFGDAGGEQETNVILDVYAGMKLGFDPKRTAKRLDRHFAQLAKTAGRPQTFERLEQLREFEARFRAALKKDENAFMQVIVPDLTRAFELMLRGEIARRGTMLVLAIHMHKEKNGRWPARLDDLDVKELAGIRTDLYSSEDFVYRVKDGQPLLYSVGVDGEDDGGLHDWGWSEKKRDGDYVFWPYPR
jgi:hypothetical protein